MESVSEMYQTFLNDEGKIFFLKKMMSYHLKYLRKHCKEDDFFMNVELNCLEDTLKMSVGLCNE